MSRRGFTLLEVMVALGILAGALLAVSDIVSGALRNHMRARNLEVATLLARGKMASLEDQYEDKGFKTFDEDEEGTFEDEGHPDVRWKVEVKMPTVELGPDQVINLLTGSSEGLAGLLGAAGGAGLSGSSGSSGSAGSSGASGSQQMAQLLGPLQSMITSSMQAVATKLGEQLKTSVRQVSLTVTWPEAGAEEHLTVTTHMVVLAPGQAAQALPQSTQQAIQQQQQQLLQQGQPPTPGGQPAQPPGVTR